MINSTSGVHTDHSANMSQRFDQMLRSNQQFTSSRQRQRWPEQGLDQDDFEHSGRSHGRSRAQIPSPVESTEDRSNILPPDLGPRRSRSDLENKPVNFGNGGFSPILRVDANNAYWSNQGTSDPGSAIPQRRQSDKGVMTVSMELCQPSRNTSFKSRPT